MKPIFVALVFILIGQGVFAQDRISSKAAFLDQIDGKSLKITLYVLTLNVLKDGSITGSALGNKVTGNWVWQDGYFCRDMKWGSRVIDFNCQLVTVKGKRMTFTTDKGAGDSATFRMVNR